MDDDDNRGNRWSDTAKNQHAKPDSDAPLTEFQHPYQKLTPDVVVDSIESLGYFSDARILALNSYENRVYQVGIEDDSPIIAKFYRPHRWSNEQILEEHAFTQTLYELDIPVVPPMQIEGQSLFLFNDFRFALYPRQGGRAPELDNLEHLYQLGQFIGRIHAVGESYAFKSREDLTVKRMGYDAVSYLLENNFIPNDLVAAFSSLCKDLLEAIQRFEPESNRFTRLSLHGDCHPGNVLWREDRPHFVDFDDAITGPAIQDLWMLLSGDRSLKQQQLSEIIEGYEQFRSFNLAELSLIEPLRALRLLNYNAWLAKRWDDPAFPVSFPWFNTDKYWAELILTLREMLAALQEPVIEML